MILLNLTEKSVNLLFKYRQIMFELLTYNVV